MCYIKNMTDVSEMVFVDVDTQNDFCAPDGSLFMTSSRNDAFRRLTALAVEHGIPIVGSVDTHSYDAWEFASNSNVGPDGEDPRFPDHCVKGTVGWLKVEGTLPARSVFVAEADGKHSWTWLARELGAGRCQAVYMEKEVYSLFSNDTAGPLLRALRRKTMVVYGVATDYCVKAAALGLREHGYDVVVVSDAIAGVTPEGTAAAITEMKVAGCQFITEKELVDALATKAA